MSMDRTFDWDFPLPRTHTGILQGNGTLGAMIWGEKNILRITLGRADLWDHRGGLQWTEDMSYANIRQCLEAGDEKRLTKLFMSAAHDSTIPRHPTVLPLGRLDIDLGKGVNLTKGTLNMADGTVVLQYERRGKTGSLEIMTDMRRSALCVRLPESLNKTTITPVPSWKYVGKHLAALAFKPPRRFRTPACAGWVQALPVDPACAVAFSREGHDLYIAVERGADAAEARQRVTELTAATAKAGAEDMLQRNQRWWRRYWRDVPSVDVPNERLSFLYWYGMYKFASFTNPDGIPASLQGAWIEEDGMPEWSSDYHFNINVQMCYQPAYHGNRLENLLPLFDMVLSWETQLRHNARVFLGIEDGVMLPHAVDDRCMCMTGFWTGSIDHACTAWVALMMYRYYRYSMDKDFLRRAYPFMVAAMRVYEEMIEKDGSALCLPVSVSPEYRGAQMNAWGKNASFQLACIHSLCESLTDASRALRKKPRAVWARIMAKLPKASLVGKQGDDTIALWEGTSLEETHRHHSHLGSITPFDTIDPEAPEWRSIIRRSLREWVLRGTGRWSGWCLTWASTINSHVGNPEAAVHFIEVFDRFFTNEGGGTVHDPCVPGFTLPICGGNAEENDDIMQMDGGMGAVTAVQEMFLHTRRGVNHLFAGAPRNWKDTSFSGMRTDGAFLVSARRKRGVVADVKVKSLAGGTFKVANPWGGPVRVIRKGMADRIVRGKTLKIATKAAENMVLRAGA